MKMHERYQIVNKARNDIERMTLDYIKTDELTEAEIALIFGELSLVWIQFAVRTERGL